MINRVNCFSNYTSSCLIHGHTLCNSIRVRDCSLFLVTLFDTCTASLGIKIKGELLAVKQHVQEHRHNTHSHMQYSSTDESNKCSPFTACWEVWQRLSVHGPANCRLTRLCSTQTGPLLMPHYDFTSYNYVINHTTKACCSGSSSSKLIPLSLTIYLKGDKFQIVTQEMWSIFLKALQ